MPHHPIMEYFINLGLLGKMNINNENKYLNNYYT